MSGTWVFRVIPSDRRAPNDEFEAIRAAVRKVLGADCRVDLEYVSDLPPSQSSKYRCALSMLDPGSARRRGARRPRTATAGGMTSGPSVGEGGKLVESLDDARRRRPRPAVKLPCSAAYG